MTQVCHVDWVRRSILVQASDGVVYWDAQRVLWHMCINRREVQDLSNGLFVFTFLERQISYFQKLVALLPLNLKDMNMSLE